MEFVKIIHPVTGGIAEVPDSSLPQHYASGWHLLADDEAPPPEPPAPEPPPMTKAQAKRAVSAETEEN